MLSSTRYTTKFSQNYCNIITGHHRCVTSHKEYCNALHIQIHSHFNGYFPALYRIASSPETPKSCKKPLKTAFLDHMTFRQPTSTESYDCIMHIRVRKYITTSGGIAESDSTYCNTRCRNVVCPSVCRLSLLQLAKAAGRNEMPHVVPSNTVWGRGTGPLWEWEIQGSEPQFCSNAAYWQIALAITIVITIIRYTCCSSWFF